MRSVIRIICMLAVCMAGYSQEGWVWQSPLPQGNSIKDLFVFDHNNLIAVGGLGTVMKTENAGEVWSVQHRTCGFEYMFYSLMFLDSNLGWIVGGDWSDGAVLHTMNGGETWTVQFQCENGLYGIYFIDANTGWAAGEEGAIYHTTNGGSQWEPQTSGTDIALETIYFNNADTGWAAGGSWSDGVVLETTDGGLNWSPLFTDEPMHKIRFQDDNSGWICGDNGTIYCTINGGKDWTAKSTGETYDLYDISFISDNQGWVISDFGFYYVTDNGGESWTRIQIEDCADWSAIGFSEAGTGWIAGDGGQIWKSIDSGVTWTSNGGGTDAWIKSVYFLDDSIGFVADNSGKIRKSTDGGASWSEMTSDYAALLLKLFFIDENTGWAVGGDWAGGVILKTSDGGETWHDQDFTASVSDFEDIYFINDQTGWAVGNSSVIVKTVNGGDTWETKMSGDKYSWHGVWFKDANTGWVLGSFSQDWDVIDVLFRTDDGGEIWNEQMQAQATSLGFITIYEGFDKMFFCSPDTGWIVGMNGTFYNTVDGGDTWQENNNSDLGSIQDIFFMNAQTGYIVNTDPEMYKTANGGETWTKQVIPTDTRIEAIYFLDEQTGWAVGWYDLVLKTINGGVSTGIIDWKKHHDIVPDQAMLYSNYPNPFNQSTVIQYQIAQSGVVQIKVYDIRGREIALLRNTWQNAGSYQIRFDAAGYASGIYLVELKAGNQVDRQKVMLVK